MTVNTKTGQNKVIFDLNNKIDINLLICKLEDYENYDDNITVKDIVLIILNCIKK